MVEGATHPDRIEVLIMEMGGKWDGYNKKFCGSEAAQKMIAEINVLDRSHRYSQLLNN